MFYPDDLNSESQNSESSEPIDSDGVAIAPDIPESADAGFEPVDAPVYSADQADVPAPYSEPSVPAEAQEPETSVPSAEYHYVRSDLSSPRYADARYSSDGHTYQPRYHYSEPDSSVKKQNKTKSRSGPGWAGVVALCVVCALLGGIAGGIMGRGSTPAASEDAPVPVETAAPAGDRNLTSSQPESTSAPIIHTSTTAGDVLSPNEIYDIACSQVVGVNTEITYTSYFGTSTAAVSGSGFIISSDGYILTNYHVIEDAYKGNYDINVILFNGDSYLATIVGFEADNDVAVLKIDADNLAPVTIADSDKMRVGDSVFAVGNPLGQLIFTMTSGMVSALDREISNTDSSTGVTTTINMFQIDAAVNRGNSGGPVYNASGEVIGIVTAKYSNTGVEGLGFAIPINDAVGIANELIEKGYVGGKAYFGITVQTVSSSVAQYYNMVVGAYIYALDPDSCAAEAGLQIGDIITKIDDTEISSSSDLIAAKKNYRAGETAVITVYRSGSYVDVTIVFDEEIPSSSSVSSPQADDDQNSQPSSPNAPRYPNAPSGSGR